MQAPGLAHSIHETGGGDNGAMVDLFSTLKRFHSVTQPSILCLHLNITAYCTKSQDGCKFVMYIILHDQDFCQTGAGNASKAPPTGKLNAMPNGSARETAKQPDGNRRWTGAKDLDNCDTFPYNGVAYRHPHKAAATAGVNACLREAHTHAPPLVCQRNHQSRRVCRAVFRIRK